MAIKLPDPGNGIPEQKTGNDEWTNMKIVRDNFADQSHAASRLVGTASGNVVEMTDTGVAGTGLGSTAVDIITPSQMDIPSQKKGFGVYRTNGGSKSYTPIMQICYPEDRYGHQLAFELFNNDILFRRAISADAYTEFFKIFHSGNTTKDVATGFLKVSSPVLHVYNDKITKIHEAEQLDIVVDKKGVGHYEIHGTTGLRKNDGWNMSPPRDIHGNVRCMIDVTEKDSIITLKTYKRKFDLELAAIVHDYDNPIDIPAGACVEFRFNDLPQEPLDEPAI